MNPTVSIDSLNLELGLKNRNTITVESHKFICLFSKDFSHELHSENKILNSLIDLQIALAESLKIHQEKVYRILERSTKVLSDLKILIPKENLDYIKDQNTKILKRVKEPQNIVEKANEKLKEVEALLIEIKKILLA